LQLAHLSAGDIKDSIQHLPGTQAQSQDRKSQDCRSPRIASTRRPGTQVQGGQERKRKEARNASARRPGAQVQGGQERNRKARNASARRPGAQVQGGQERKCKARSASARRPGAQVLHKAQPECLDAMHLTKVISLFIQNMKASSRASKKQLRSRTLGLIL